jgi:hypothetical protein
MAKASLTIRTVRLVLEKPHVCGIWPDARPRRSGAAFVQVDSAWCC